MVNKHKGEREREREEMQKIKQERGGIRMSFFRTFYNTLLLAEGYCSMS